MAAVVHPYHAYQLVSEPDYTFANPRCDAQTKQCATASSALSAASTYTSQLTSLLTVTATQKGAVFAPESLCIAMKRDFNLETERNASLRAFELNATAVYGVAELDDSYGVEMFFDATL